jgi:DNA segregation ATPase FtsK/SpoIIIE, S-DNA-T family
MAQAAGAVLRGPAGPRRAPARAPKPPAWQERARALAVRLGLMVLGAALLLGAASLLLSLLSYSPSDPSFNVATAAAPANWLGTLGAYTADMLLQSVGLGAVALALPLLAFGVRLLKAQPLERWRRQLLWAAVATLLLAIAAAALPLAATWPITAGFGGALGGKLFAGLQLLTSWTGLVMPMWPFALLFALGGLVLAALASGLGRGDWSAAFTGLGGSMGNGISRAWGALRKPLDRRADERAIYDDEADDLGLAEAPALATKPDRREPRILLPGESDDANRITERPAAPRPGKRVSAERQQSLALGDSFALPPLDLLTAAPRGSGANIDTAALEQNARLLESVLQDFGVDGRILNVRPGPVVTMYELEPAPGIKSSRVIGLADDIARSMSAISARVAVVPGRNVIGIELPNHKRETVYLRELLASATFEKSKGPLPMVLGKDISGEPVIADLAPMPHLLIAGATGSGKSVGLNAMILSLLYRLTPDQCRLIMIDPKMLELSIYDGIPHLLSPVVTEPKKAIVALKWAVREMDERYRKMAKLSVRNLAAFNEKVAEAKRKGGNLLRKVHTGYDPDSGEPIYEDQSFDFDVMPLVVVIVDELADLMMMAGKEVEFLVQRLAQKARAAGIHLILATQRPSVDVITGVIKANLPTRVSFAVTSKIDSRTILNEQGAEQLLGRGDMLYMSGGKQLTRVHGPFVSDEEVERVATFWRDQGAPDYLNEVTQGGDDDDDEGGVSVSGGKPKDGGGDDLLSKAIEVVQSEQKASTSFIQRHLRIGYNSAARLIEQMEKLGVVSAPDHVGRREVLINEDGSRR